MIWLWLVLALVALVIVICAVNTVRVGSKSTGDAPELSVDSDRVQRYASALSHMIQCNTVTNNDDNTAIYQFHQVLQQEFPLIFSQLEVHDIDNGALLIRWPGSRGNKLPILMMAHQDVVPATGDWKYPPFSGHIDEEGNIWGRGAVDTKGSLCAILCSVEELLQEGYVPENDVYIASSKNEEKFGSGAPATVDYLKQQGVRLSLVIDEGGAIVNGPLPGLKGNFAMIGLMEKGNGTLKFVAKSNGGHASTPVDNTPIARLAKFVAHVDNKHPLKRTMTRPVEQMFTALAPYMTGAMKCIVANLWLFRGLFVKILAKASPTAGAMLGTTCAFTMCKGSDADNVVPAKAELIANVRYMLNQPAAQANQLLKQLAAKYDVQMQVVKQVDCSAVADVNSDGYHMVEQALKAVFPDCGYAPYIMLQGSDSRHYEAVCDCVLKFAPLIITAQQLASIHGVNENLNSVSLARAVGFYKQLIQENHA